MEKSVALFYCKNISKKFEKVLKKILTNAKKCVIIVTKSDLNALKKKEWGMKMKNTLKRKKGIFYANGKRFATFIEAISFLYNNIKEVK